MNAMSKQAFVDMFGGVYEHSPWVAEAVWNMRRDAATDLHAAFRRVLDQADHDAKLTLLRAHPDLAGKLAIHDKLTPDSTTEQAGAGLDSCTEEEFAEFQDLNQRYQEKFGFPFILAVRGYGRGEILQAFRQRIANDVGTEFETALEQVHRIALLRLRDIPRAGAPELSDNDPPQFVRDFVNLASPKLGARVIWATDDFFAPKDRLIRDEEPVFISDKYDDNGKWMDGWESRRRRDGGNDHCIVALDAQGIVKGVDIDTRHFTGNHPPFASVEGCLSDSVPDGATEWTEIAPKSAINADSHNYVGVTSGQCFNYLRLNIYPDGGVARLRVYGQPLSAWLRHESDGVHELSSIMNGGRIVGYNDAHYGSPWV
ncbi:MAG: 2-oxo-4-hydroxy-4-carboxy-5-ureidoimidazoline decarboxylase, partial [Rhodospirillales bacterium]|nr:2-oxo-4-hydroxy-4-carboxy-5-ureidoimidazoline decarboxylase [Rhodospirillales bacterium]